MEKRLITLITVVISLMCFGATCSKGLHLDESMAAIEAGDYTALVQGCGNQLVPGYTYCRKTEGEIANDSLIFVGPSNIVCSDNESCIHIKIFFPDQTPALGVAIPKGKSQIVVPWQDILKKSTYEITDRGFWPFIYSMKFMDDKGQEQETRTEGEIRMRVLRKSYIPLNDVSSDSNFVWKWKFGSVPVRMTTGGRTYVGSAP